MLGKLIKANKAICRWMIGAGWAREEDDVVSDMRELLLESLEARSDQEGKTRILEVGGTSRPFLPRDDKYLYHGLDIDDTSATDEKYDHFHLQSVAEPIDGEYDLIFSKYLLEHVDDNTAAFKAMANCLSEGGEMVHLIPCGWHPYSVATRLIGNRMQRMLIRILRPESVGFTGYPAFYDSCTVNGIRRQLEQNGLEVETLKPYWGASEYFAFFVPAFVGIKTFNWLAKKLGISVLASVLILRAKRPCSAESSSPAMSKAA